MFCFQLTSLSIFIISCFHHDFFSGMTNGCRNLFQSSILTDSTHLESPTEGCSWPHLLTSNVQASYFHGRTLLSHEKKLPFYDTGLPPQFHNPYDPRGKLISYVWPKQAVFCYCSFVISTYFQDKQIYKFYIICGCTPTGDAITHTGNTNRHHWRNSSVQNFLCTTNDTLRCVVLPYLLEIIKFSWYMMIEY